MELLALKEKIGEAKWLIRSINKRNETVHNVGKLICKIQADFLTNKSPELKPVSNIDLAKELKISASSVSRILRSKYIQTPKGAVSMKSLLASSVSKTRKVTPMQLMEEIQNIVEGEREKLSDKDKKDWNNFINSSQRVENKDKDSVGKENIQSYISIDLHGYTLDQANKKVSELILSSYEKGIRNINIITGKGNRSSNQQDPYQSKNLSILKYAIPDFITNNLDLMNKIIKIDYQAVNEPTSGSFSILLKKN